VNLHTSNPARSERAVPEDWPVVDVIIPVLNERRSIGLVLDDIPRNGVREIVVVDNGSTDGTASVAREHGATVIVERRRGYGSACLAGIAELRRRPHPPDVVVFLDGDYSDHPTELVDLVQPIAAGECDFVVGSRVLGRRDPGALLPQARWGNRLASWMIRGLYGLPVSDLGPFRAIRWGRLLRLGMIDTDFGWTAEMQVKAARAGLSYREVPVSYRRRVGVSKITGTLSGTLGAGWKIIFTILKHRT
jgi:glycosyltransferase involved in cell wall biosynthesis